MKKVLALLKSKAGMTFVELLTALALLVIIITSFTPMLLNSYETLYKAGEISEKTYISKTEVEKSLASRDSETIGNFKLEFESLSKEMFIKMRAALTDIQGNDWIQSGIQTFYYGGNGYIKVVSPSTIPDNEPWKEIVIQFKGIKVNDVVEGGDDAAKIVTQSGKEDEYIIGVEVVLPNTSEGSAVVSEGELFDASKNALETGQYEVSVDPNNDKQAIIRIYESVDVVTSLIQINAHYLDENKNKNVATAYVKITPANIMLVGETSTVKQDVEIKDVNGNVVHVAEIPNVAYYTSAGVVAQKNDAGIITGYGFNVYPRTLSTKNTPSLVSYSDNANLPFPKGTHFNTIEWIDTDTSGYLSPYYVMTGSNGVIQRLFLSNGSATEASAIVGKTLTGAPYEDGGLTKMFYPTFWGGDRSHQFGFSTFYEDGSSTSTGYYNESDVDSCWYTGDKDTASGLSEYDKYGSQTKFAMYFNGFGSWNSEEMRNGRRISYVLIEAGVPLRATGVRTQTSDKFGGFIRSWEGADTGTSGITGVVDTLSNTEEDNWNSSDPEVIRVVDYDKDDAVKEPNFLSYLNLISYGNVLPSELINESKDDSRVNYLDNSANAEYVNNINITSAIYNVASGEMMYLGSVPAYGFVQQIDQVSSSDDYASKYQPETFGTNKKNIPVGGYTGYWIDGTVSEGTRITKISAENDRGFLYNAIRTAIPEINESTYAFSTKTFSVAEGTADANNRTTFYVERTYNDANYQTHTNVNSGTNFFYVLNDTNLEFTMGYSSNREQVFSNITYGRRLTYSGSNLVESLVEQHNSYEEYFNLTHYGDRYRSNGPIVNSTYEDLANTYYLDETLNHKNLSSNSTYNVWFPGEFYNLTHTATKDGLTIAVGYTVSGSSYQRFHRADYKSRNTNNSSTALGGIFNDGVLAIMTNDETSFKNILYYKDYTQFQDSDITDNSYLNSVLSNIYTTTAGYSKYGTHARANVRFTAIDIYTLGEEGTEKSYYAIYGDNHGRVFFSLVAQVTGTSHAVVDRIGDSAGNYGSLGALSSVNQFTDTAGQPLSTHFSEITNITVDDTVIYVTGRGNGANQPPKIAVAKNIPSGDLTFTVIDLVNVPSSENYLINDMMNLSGYIYIAGEIVGSEKGFCCAVSTNTLTQCVDKGYDSLADYVRELGLNEAENDSEINPALYSEVMPYIETATKIYSIAGYSQ